ncbi:MAG: WbqC family protein [Fuerstiella sp.]
MDSGTRGAGEKSNGRLPSVAVSGSGAAVPAIRLYSPTARPASTSDGSLASACAPAADRVLTSATAEGDAREPSVTSHRSTGRPSLGMMQPYFFPYLGYFGLIHATDRWVVFDTPQYIRRGWVNRNRVLASGASPWKYARVPVARCPPSTPIREVQIDGRQAWQDDLFNNLDAYRLRRAPHYAETIEFLKVTLSLQTEQLSELLIHCLRCCCEYLKLPLDCHVFSRMQLSLPSISDPGDWAFETAKAVGASSYINPPGGQSLFNPEKFREANIRLQFLTAELPAYHQGRQEFIPGLSIIDALMWNEVSAVRDMVADYTLKAA